MTHLIVAALALSAGPSRPPSDVVDLLYFSQAGPRLIRLHVRIDGQPYRQKFDALINGIFDSCDRNRDGVLDAKEAALLPSLGGRGGGRFGGAFVAPGLGGLQPAPKGRLTRADVEAHYAAAGVVPFRMGGGNPYAGRLFFPGGRPQRTAPQVTARLIKLLDANGDGKLSRAELAAAEKAFLKLDANEDELVTVDELMDDPRVADGGGLGMAVIVLEGGGLPNPDSLDFVVLTSAAAQSEAARRLKALRQAMPTRPAAEVHVRLSSERGTVTVTADKLTKGVMARKEGNGIVLEVGKAHLSLGGPRRGSSTVFSVADGSEAYQMLFKQADADGNGYLDRKEAATVPLFGRNFDAIDADGDGMIFEKEVSAFLKKRATLQASVKAATAELSITEQGQGLFDLLDLNRDGVLSVRELRRAPEVLKLLGVKELAASDVPRQLLGTLAPGGDSGGLGFFAVNTLDLGGERPARPAPGKGPEWFRKMDRNGDGDVSRSEWLGTREEFARIDADRDGLISPEEAEAYDRAVRKKGAE